METLGQITYADTGFSYHEYLVSKEYFTCGGMEKPHDHFYSSGFTGPIGPNETEDFTRFDGQVESVQSIDLTVTALVSFTEIVGGKNHRLVSDIRKRSREYFQLFDN